MRILLSGGGTLGPVIPLIALVQKIRQDNASANFLLVGTRQGPERIIAGQYNIPFIALPAGKFRRYFSLKNIFTPLLLLAGLFRSFFLILKFKPSVIVSAGGYISVPIVWAGWIVRIPILIHQQDVRAGLANKLMAPFASVITVSVEDSLNDFPEQKTQLVGNPIREDMKIGSKEEACAFFQFDPKVPVVLVLGGGTGARAINQLLYKSLEEMLQFCQVIHVTGFSKGEQVPAHNRYRSFEFLKSELPQAYTAADVVVTRAGMSTLTELAILQKGLVIIPIPQSHQEENAVFFARNNAAKILEQSKTAPEDFVQTVKHLVSDKTELENLRRNIKKLMPQDAAEKMADIVMEMQKR